MMGMRKRLLAIALVIGAVGLVTTVSLAAMNPIESMKEEWKIALQHSKLAQNYSTMDVVQQHLQHVINCIEGPKGGMYSEAAGNPCEGKGNGMMVDAKAAGGKAAAAMVWMEVSGDVAASIGMKAKSVDKAKAAAWVTMIVLDHAGTLLK